MPAWTYAALKAVDAALSGAPLPLPAATAAINAQTTVGPSVDIPWASIRDLILNAQEWGSLEQVANTAILATLPTGGGIQSAAIQADALFMRAGCLHGGMLGATGTTLWSKFTATLSRLVGAMAITQTTATAIIALRMPTVPTWAPAVLPADIQTARAQP